MGGRGRSGIISVTHLSVLGKFFSLLSLNSRSPSAILPSITSVCLFSFSAHAYAHRHKSVCFICSTTPRPLSGCPTNLHVYLPLPRLPRLTRRHQRLSECRRPSHFHNSAVCILSGQAGNSLPPQNRTTAQTKQRWRSRTLKTDGAELKVFLMAGQRWQHWSDDGVFSRETANYLESLSK